MDYLDAQLNKIFLNEYFTINYTSITDFITHHFFSDLETDYQNDCVRQALKDFRAKEVIYSQAAKLLKKHRRKKYC